MSDNVVTAALRDGRVPVGAMLYEFDTVGIGRVLAGARADFAIFDFEHTGWDPGRIRWVLAAARADDVLTVVRVIRADYSQIAGALDAGAGGVMVPMVESGEQARYVVECAKYPPVGRRGFGAIYSDQTPDGPAAFVERVNRESLVIAQVESRAGIENADDIAATEGVDVVWLGHFDLSCSLGIPGRFDHPDFKAAVSHLRDACARHDKPLGQMIFDADEGRVMLEKGFRVLAFGDVWLFERALRSEIASVRAESI